MSFLRTFGLALSHGLRYLSDRITHKLIFRNSLTAGVVHFHSLSEEDIVVDGHVILFDQRFKEARIYAYHFDNRYLVHATPHERCIAVWHECMDMDGIRPLGTLEAGKLCTPYGPTQPIPHRYLKLFQEEQQRAAEFDTDPSFV